MKDKVMLVLAFIGFVIIAVVTISNTSADELTKTFSVDSYYVPKSEVDKAGSSALLYQELIGTRTIQCPVTDLSQTRNGVVSVLGLYGSSINKSAYNNIVFFLGQECYSDLVNLYRDGEEVSTKTLSLQFGLDAKILSSKEAVTIGKLLHTSVITDGKGAISNPVELVAPFNFIFDNLNSNPDKSIVILNKGGDIKITFSNVANWFCAGTYGTTMTVGNGKDSGNVCTWEEHNSNHLTIIGKSQNSEVTGGTAGDVIGYATVDTTVSIELRDSNGNWRPISISEWLSKTM